MVDIRGGKTNNVTGYEWYQDIDNYIQTRLDPLDNIVKKYMKRTGSPEQEIQEYG
jgi:hypothetical protein